MLALPIINHLIQQNRETQAVLAGYNGIVVAVNAAGLHIKGRFNAEGFLEASERAADAEITFQHSALQKVLQGQTPGVGDVALAGDTALALALLPLLGSLRYYANDDLSRLFGDAVAGGISARTAQVAQTLKQIGQSLMGQLGDYAREPEAPVITREEFEAWTAEVDRLRDDVARLQARMDKWASSPPPQMMK
ncbi:SCP2 domain-containing protein [Uruburuella testudinis]|uniref:SCP2 domain-containing protein n=1 Tax=Uruburuella testudinis TaxID=1282863 RepID=A0ABY4DX85_9NEIS|nr:SCP2 domain-containing protein [Uruburuella testudinis]UOO81306.1 SCP2 domain-containing protein [Uruburuella testudinis]